MLESLIDFDVRLFLNLNQAGFPFLDPFMKFMSSAWVWIPVFSYILFHQVQKYQKDPMSRSGILLEKTFIYRITDKWISQFWKIGYIL